MAKFKLSMNEFVRDVCDDLGHKDEAHMCVKKIVQENWLDDVDDLLYVPRHLLETWGLPLKFIAVLYERVHDRDAKRRVSSLSAFMNYRVKVAIAQMSLGPTLDRLKDDAERRNHPELWAARRLQRWFRRRARRLDQPVPARKESSFALEKEDFRRLNEDAAEERRVQRARERIARLVRLWRLRRIVRLAVTAAKLGNAHLREDRVSASREPAAQLGSAYLQGVSCPLRSLKDCEVTRLMRKLARKAGRAWEEVLPHAHTLVTANWLESTSDLEIVEDHHWTKWGVPEKLVLLIKRKLERDASDGLASAMATWRNRFVASIARDTDAQP